MNRYGIYPGSFDPFTNGHLDVVRKAAALLDHVYVLIGINANKKRSFDGELMKMAIEKTLEHEGLTNCTVCVYNGLVAEFAKQNNVKYMVRGLRNNMDYNYEESIAEVNKLIYSQMEYVYFRAENIALSSSMVKELHQFGQDVSAYVPQPIMDLLK